MNVGLHLDDVPQGGLGRLAEVEEVVGPIEVVHWFQAWGGGHRRFEPRWLDAVAGSGRAGLISWEPWALTGDPTQPAFAPASIVAGDHDDYIRAWAEGFAARDDGPWYLRPMHEMNGTWYPWSGGDPDRYRRAWRHIRQVFADAGVGNVRWVWCPLVDDVAGPFEAYHPGPDQVDVLALDGYNWGAGTPEYGGWREPAELFGPACRRLIELGPQPVWLAEAGSAADGGDKAAWVAEVLRGEFCDRLAAVVFFGLDKERDWRIDDDPRVAAAVRAATR